MGIINKSYAFIEGQFDWVRANWKQLVGWYIAYQYGPAAAQKAGALYNFVIPLVSNWK